MRVNFTNAHTNTNPKLIIDEEEDNENEEPVEGEQQQQYYNGDDQYDKDEINKNHIDIGNANAKIVVSDEKLIKESSSLNLAKQIVSLPKQQQQLSINKTFKSTTTNSLKHTRDTKKTLKASAPKTKLAASSNYVFKVKIRTQDKTLSTESINVKCEKMNTTPGKYLFF